MLYYKINNQSILHFGLLFGMYPILCLKSGFNHVKRSHQGCDEHGAGWTGHHLLHRADLPLGKCAVVITHSEGLYLALLLLLSTSTDWWAILPPTLTGFKRLEAMCPLFHAWSASCRPPQAPAGPEASSSFLSFSSVAVPSLARFPRWHWVS